MSGETVYRLWYAAEPAGDAVQSTSDASNACGVPGGEQTVHLTERVGIWLLTARGREREWRIGSGGGLEAGAAALQ